jgi:hypothetical protein
MFKFTSTDYMCSQCCIPCFEQLLPAPHDSTVASLLYLAVYWHSLTKLHIHTDTTLKVLDNVTVLFAKSLCHFSQATCPCFNTVETDREYRARHRAAEIRASKQTNNTASSSVTFCLGLVGFREVHTQTTIGTVPTHISYVPRV